MHALGDINVRFTSLLAAKRHQRELRKSIMRRADARSSSRLMRRSVEAQVDRALCTEAHETSEARVRREKACKF